MSRTSAGFWELDANTSERDIEIEGIGGGNLETTGVGVGTGEMLIQILTDEYEEESETSTGSGEGEGTPTPRNRCTRGSQTPGEFEKHHYTRLMGRGELEDVAEVSSSLADQGTESGDDDEVRQRKPESLTFH